jgi:hypothetical protein
MIRWLNLIVRGSGKQTEEAIPGATNVRKPAGNPGVQRLRDIHETAIPRGRALTGRPDLARPLQRWCGLPSATRAGIVAMLNAVNSSRRLSTNEPSF